MAQRFKCLPAMWETWVRSLGSIPGSGRSPGEGNGNPLQYPCLESPMDGRAWWATVHGGLKESDMTEQVHFTSWWISGKESACHCKFDPRVKKIP